MKPSFFSAKGARPQQIAYDRMLHWDNVNIVHACVGSSLFREAKNPFLKIAIPFGQTSIQASWQTATGFLKKQHVRTGHISIMPAEMSYETHWKSQSEIIILCFQPKLITTIGQELIVGDRVEIIEQWTAQDLLIQQLTQALRTELQYGSPSRLYVDAISTIVISHLLREYSTAKLSYYGKVERSQNQQIRDVLEYIDNNLGLDLSLAELAQIAQMSLYRFSRTFKQVIGLSPHQYLLKRKVECAKTLLVNKELSLLEISYQLGFSSQSHFTTTFKRCAGVTPNAYREAI